MDRSKWQRKANHPKPVERVELSEKNIGLRFAIVAALIIIAVLAFGYGVSQLFSIEEGFRAISADSSAETNSSEEFVFLYNVGSRSDMTPVAEHKAVVALYTDVMVKSHKLFHTNQSFTDVKNVYDINKHPNEVVTVDKVLYEAFSQLQEHGDRTIYLAPVYDMYEELFLCETEEQTKHYDPYANEEVALFYQQIADFANDEASIKVELLGKNQIKLVVSEDYLKFCEENDITRLIDFSWMKNAFIIDYLADELVKNGFTACCISSIDGYVRNLDSSDTKFSLSIHDYVKDEAFQKSAIEYKNAISIVSMRDFPFYKEDAYRYYKYSNGDIRTLYLDTKDALCKSAVHNLYAYSKESECAEIMLQMKSVYISDALNQEGISKLLDYEIYSIYCEDGEIIYNDSSLTFSKE